VRFIDPTGKWIVGTNGKPVTYSEKTGWSKNASADVQRIGNAMMISKTATERLNYLLGSEYKTSMSISSEKKELSNGKYLTGNTDVKGIKKFPDGSITIDEFKITIYEGSIEHLTGNESGDNPYKGLSIDEGISVSAGHESGHATMENTKISILGKSNGEIEEEPLKIDAQINREIKTSNSEKFFGGSIQPLNPANISSLIEKLKP
jgi:hypothetical protein